MDWLWPLYRQYVQKQLDWSASPPGETPLAPREMKAGEGPRGAAPPADEGTLQAAFLGSLAGSTATLYVMEPVGDTIRFRGLGRWALPEVPELLADPNGFIADRFGGGKYKINFHHGATFVCTHNFRTPGEQRWRQMDELTFE